MKKIIIPLILIYSTLNAADVNVVRSSSDIYKKCIKCHGQKGEIEALGVSKKISSMKANDIEEALKGYKMGVRNVYNFGGLMKGQVLSLSDDEIKKLSEYISKLK